MCAREVVTLRRRCLAQLRQLRQQVLASGQFVVPDAELAQFVLDAPHEGDVGIDARLPRLGPLLLFLVLQLKRRDALSFAFDVRAAVLEERAEALERGFVALGLSL